MVVSIDEDTKKHKMQSFVRSLCFENLVSRICINLNHQKAPGTTRFDITRFC